MPSSGQRIAYHPVLIMGPYTGTTRNSLQTRGQHVARLERLYQRLSDGRNAVYENGEGDDWESWILSLIRAAGQPSCPPKARTTGCMIAYCRPEHFTVKAWCEGSSLVPWSWGIKPFFECFRLVNPTTLWRWQTLVSHIEFTFWSSLS